MSRKLLRILVWTVVIAGAILGLLRLTAIRWWRVPSNDPWFQTSVTPTLQAGDLVVLWRLTRPTQYDLVLCPEPGAPTRVVLGRVMGEGNDLVSADQTGLSINGRHVRTERACGTFTVRDPRTAAEYEQTCSMEDVEGRLHPRGNQIPEAGPPAPLKTVKVPPGKFFLLSDNRQFPLDSRDFGVVDAASCKETVVFRLWGAKGYFDGSRRFDWIW